MDIQGDSHQIHLGEERYQNAYENASVTIPSPKGNFTIDKIDLKNLLKSGDGIEIAFSLRGEEFSFFIGDTTPLYQRLQELKDEYLENDEIKNTAATLLVYKNIAAMLAVADVAKPIIAQFSGQSNSTVEIFNEGEEPLEKEIELSTKVSEQIAHKSPERIKTTYRGNKKTRSASDQLKHLGTAAKVDNILSKLRKAEGAADTSSSTPLTEENLNAHNARNAQETVQSVTSEATTVDRHVDNALFQDDEINTATSNTTGKETAQIKRSTALPREKVNGLPHPLSTASEDPISDQPTSTPLANDPAAREEAQNDVTEAATKNSNVLEQENTAPNREDADISLEGTVLAQILGEDQEASVQRHAAHSDAETRQEAVDVLRVIREGNEGANVKTFFYLKNWIERKDQQGKIEFLPSELEIKNEIIQGMRKDIQTLTQKTNNQLIQEALKSLEQELNQAELTNNGSSHK